MNKDTLFWLWFVFQIVTVVLQIVERRTHQKPPLTMSDLTLCCSVAFLILWIGKDN